MSQLSRPPGRPPGPRFRDRSGSWCRRPVAPRPGLGGHRKNTAAGPASCRTSMEPGRPCRRRARPATTAPARRVPVADLRGGMAAGSRPAWRCGPAMGDFASFWTLVGGIVSPVRALHLSGPAVGGNTTLVLVMAPKVPVSPVARGVALTCTTPVKWRPRSPVIRLPGALLAAPGGLARIVDGGDLAGVRLGAVLKGVEADLVPSGSCTYGRILPMLARCALACCSCPQWRSFPPS